MGAPAWEAELVGATSTTRACRPRASAKRLEYRLRLDPRVFDCHISKVSGAGVIVCFHSEIDGLTAAFDAVLTAIDVQVIKTPVQAPRTNAIAERFIGTIRHELLDRILVANQRHATAS
jgi:hypothetical protein